MSLPRRSLLALALVLTACCGTSWAGLVRPPSGPAVVPHNGKAAIYDLFGLNKYNQEILSTIATHLSQEGYDVTIYRDTKEGWPGGRGSATLANFVKMAKTASVIVINTHGTDFVSSAQSCIHGKGVSRTGNADTTPICNTNHQQPVQQVEWYPSMDALHAAYARYLKAGYKKE